MEEISTQMDGEVAEPSLAMARRISALVEAVGGLERASGISGKSTDMLRRYANLQSSVPLEPIARLAQHAGYSLDWVVHGIGGPDAAAAFALRRSSLDPGQPR